MYKQQASQELAIRELARRSFYHFLLLKWERFEEKKLLKSWHIEYLCKVLECTQKNTCENEELITRLILNMPPSYGKTEIIARCFIAWSLGRNPEKNFFTSPTAMSYAKEFVNKLES
ncbi:hypothetical protein HpBHB49_16050 [Helicobacter pylori]